MRSTQIMNLKYLSLAAVLVGAASLVGCGGGAALPGGSTLLLDGPVLTPPPSGGNLPDPIPMPPGGGQGSPVDPVDPAPVEPTPDPITEPVDPPAGTPAPDLAHVRAMAVVPINPLVLDPAEVYTGVYVANEAGEIWRGFAGGGWEQVADLGDGFTIEAMTYVAPRHALYLALATITGQTRLVRYLFTPTPPVYDLTVIPPVLVDAGGVRLQLLEDSGGAKFLAGAASVTGLAFDTAAGLLFGWDHDGQSLFHLADLDVADATWDASFWASPVISFADVQDLAYDRANGRLLVLDRASAAVIELDHLGLASLRVVTLPYADVRAIAWEEVGTRLAVDRDSAALIRFDRDGAVLE
jgi:hypothetical protein